MIKPSFDFKLDLILGLGFGKDDALKVRQALTEYEQELDRLNQMVEEEKQSDHVVLVRPVFAGWIKWVAKNSYQIWFAFEKEPFFICDGAFIPEVIGQYANIISDDHLTYLDNKYGHLPWAECKFRVEDV